MDNKTPPAWAMEAAQAIEDECHYDFRPPVNYAAQLISEHAPDAEALAEALEQAITNCKGASEYGHGMNLTVVHGSCCSEPRAALAAYRARFPKVKVTP